MSAIKLDHGWICACCCPCTMEKLPPRLELPPTAPQACPTRPCEQTRTPVHGYHVLRIRIGTEIFRKKFSILDTKLTTPGHWLYKMHFTRRSSQIRPAHPQFRRDRPSSTLTPTYIPTLRNPNPTPNPASHATSAPHQCTQFNSLDPLYDLQPLVRHISRLQRTKTYRDPHFVSFGYPTGPP